MNKKIIWKLFPYTCFISSKELGKGEDIKTEEDSINDSKDNEYTSKEEDERGEGECEETEEYIECSDYSMESEEVVVLKESKSKGRKENVTYN